MIHLDLQPELEAQLTAEAQARGIGLERLIEQMSKSQFGAEPTRRAKSRTIAEAVDRILCLREDTRPGAPSIKDLINEGRKY